ncbi:MAG: RnfABCDGE type electron transport complex subunit B [Candidatus Omnitrophota bacterium]|nr:RnfABCDGE type electron transport complex subunit B [Candidatus Omnitrophota bacterium]
MNSITISILTLGSIGLGFSLLLSFLSKKLHVVENPLVEKIVNALPGLNCGACGFSGCHAYAQGIIKNKKIFNGCLPGGKELNEVLIKLLGIDAQVAEDKTGLVCHCGADNTHKKKSFLYNGPQTCATADLIGGNYDCIYGCLALGDCIKVCPTAALQLKNEKIYIDNEKCVSCGKCVKKCPRNLFEIVGAQKSIDTFIVACSNKEKGKNVMDVCKQGCIGCGICAKAPDSPFYLENNLAYIDRAKANDQKLLEAAKTKCPTKCILIEKPETRNS